MKKICSPFLFFALFTLGVFNSQGQTLKIPAPSPFQKISQDFATSKITIEYSRPSVKGRTIFGDLVPYDSIWRVGANASTKIMFGEDVMVEGKAVPVGKYALYIIPKKDEWTLILSKDTTLSGTSGYKQANDLFRFQVKPMALPMSIETMTFMINNIKPASCDIQLLWDKVMISFNVTADIDKKIMAQIDEAMKGEKPPYWQAANYYFENGKDINKAYEWVNKALVDRPDAYFIMTAKAKMELKMGKKSEAVTTATKALELSKKEGDNNFVKQNEKIINDAKAMK
jgi:hypothetical protein